MAEMEFKFRDFFKLFIKVNFSTQNEQHQIVHPSSFELKFQINRYSISYSLVLNLLIRKSTVHQLSDYLFVRISSSQPILIKNRGFFYSNFTLYSMESFANCHFFLHVCNLKSENVLDIRFVHRLRFQNQTVFLVSFLDNV